MPTEVRLPSALLIGHEEQENLGLRSILATLRAAGYRAELVPFSPGEPSRLLRAVEEFHPDLVGFSIIFQYTLDDFAALASALRQAGCRAHLTAGGHFPTMRPSEVLAAIPELDSIVRGEGELTVLELLPNAHRPSAWPSILGLALRVADGAVVNPPRPLIADLDSLPLAIRGKQQLLTRGVRAASMTASRGCLHDCSFCSIRQFYESAPGPLRRVRSPEAVASEMRMLYEEQGIRFFIFQDDDFAARSAKQRRWMEAFLQAIDDSGLSGNIGWKISCRVDDVVPDLFASCRARGLLTVYLGVESGSPSGLRTLHKKVTVDDNLRAISSLKRIGLGYDMGFMLFDPDSTFATVRENIEFLRRATGDGTCPADFAKMLPYAATPIEMRLAREGRLRGSLTQPDYDFLDRRLDLFAEFVARVFRARNVDVLGLLERLRLARFDQILGAAFNTVDSEYEVQWRILTARANAVALDTLEAGLAFVEWRDVQRIMDEWESLGEIARREWEVEAALQQELDRLLEVHSPELLKAYEIERASRNGMPEGTSAQ